MKKVLFVATVTAHINTFHIPYLKLFKEQGYEVHVASKGNEDIKYCDRHYDLPFERFPLKKNNLKVYRELKRIIKDNQYEIIHCHTPVGGVLTRLAAKKARKNGTRVIYTAHGFHFYSGAPLLNWIIYYPLEKWLSRYTDSLITINQEDYERAKKKFKKCKKIEFVHGVGFDSNRFNICINNTDKIKLKESLKINDEDIIISYVAELNQNKNQMLLINTIEEINKKQPKYKLLLIGDGPNKNKYIKEIKKSNLEEYVKILGKRSDIPLLLSITDIYVATSIREGLGLNVLEAMYMNLPIIATNNRGHRELIKKDHLIKNNKNELKQKILNLSHNAPNYNIDANTYEINNVLNEMMAIYEEVKS